MNKAELERWMQGHRLAAERSAAQAAALPARERVARLEQLRRDAIELGWQTSDAVEDERVWRRFQLLRQRLGHR